MMDLRLEGTQTHAPARGPLVDWRANCALERISYPAISLPELITLSYSGA